MKLLLSSKAFGNPIITKKILGELKMDVQKIRVLFIPTALSGTYPPDKYMNELLIYGLNKENIIIFDEKILKNTAI